MCILITRFLQCCQDRFLTVSEGKFSFKSVKVFEVGGEGRGCDLLLSKAVGL
jgi:hypothetical protein